MAIGKSWKWLVALGAVFVPASLLATVSVPYSFTPGTVIRSAEINANFAVLREFVDSLEAAIQGKADRPASGNYVNSAQGRMAYLWVDDYCSTSSTPDCTSNSYYAYSSAGSMPTSTRNSQGEYTVTFPDISASTGGHAQVTAYGDGSNHCKVVGWSDTYVLVRCFDTAGNLADSMFTVMFLY